MDLVRARAMKWTSPGISRWLAGSFCRVSARLVSQTAFSLTMVILTISLSGCQWVSRQVANQDRRCEQLCKDAEALHEQGDFRHASSLLSEIEKSSPKNASTRDMKARLLWESGRHQAAIAEYRSLADQFAGDPQPVVNLAQCYLELGQIDEAQLATEAALLRDSQSVSARMLLGKIHERQRDYDAAYEMYRSVSDLWPDDVAAKLAMARVQIERGQADRACPILRELMHHPYATLPQQREAEWQLGLAYASNQRWEDAVQRLEQSIAERELSADDWYHLAEAQFHTGSGEHARISVQKSLAMQPDHRGATTLAQMLSANTGADAIAKRQSHPGNVAQIQPAGFSATR
ncbi:hypothetical protein A6X21_19990 [Planctopirus hydrillae]|uniref:Uncharacterized protein n=2 Tax=Planctopirus hydrillae TaxID=1841610 RepID=A0A1C3EHC2_9PLAN|nr:hypothetical protein A6X21_19990 [Planctopirus hydrillae]